jgi:hypothetical protein
MFIKVGQILFQYLFEKQKKRNFVYFFHGLVKNHTTD